MKKDPFTPSNKAYFNSRRGMPSLGKIPRTLYNIYEVSTHSNGGKDGSRSFSIIFYCRVVEIELYKRKRALIC
jgi:hypothetical protein